jgi:hypothetical protein
LWLLALIVLWGVAIGFYGACAAANKGLLRLTRLAWMLAIGLTVAFLAVFHMSTEFRRGIENEWRKHDGGVVVRTDSAAGSQVALD